MKRLIFLIVAVVLLFDLAEDGCLGRVKCVASHHPAKCSVASSHQASGQVDSQVVLPSVDLGEFGHQFTAQPVSGGIVHVLNLDDFCYLGSSGGLPL